MMNSKKHYIIPIFVPHYGCPHDCVFCNQRKITNVSTSTSPEDVKKIIEEYLGYFNREAYIEVAFYGGSFTAIDINTQIELLQIPYEYRKSGLIDGIRISTRPDAIDIEKLENLKKYRVDTIELGVQSLDRNVLMKSERGHSVESVYMACKLIKENGFRLGLQMMLGLPEDNWESILFTAREFIRLKPDCVRIYPTLVIKDTSLERSLKTGKYRPLTLDEAIDITTYILMLFYLNNINVIRVGLQVTDNIQMGADVVDGPFHPAFRQLVESNILRLILDYYFEENTIELKDKILEISSNNKNISNIAGQKSSNIKYFQNKYGIKQMKIHSKDIDKNDIIIKVDEYHDKIEISEIIQYYINKNIDLK